MVLAVNACRRMMVADYSRFRLSAKMQWEPKPWFISLSLSVLMAIFQVQSASQIVTTNKPTPNFFYRPDALPTAQPTVSKH